MSESTLVLLMIHGIASGLILAFLGFRALSPDTSPYSDRLEKTRSILGALAVVGGMVVVLTSLLIGWASQPGDDSSTRAQPTQRGPTSLPVPSPDMPVQPHAAPGPAVAPGERVESMTGPPELLIERAPAAMRGENSGAWDADQPRRDLLAIVSWNIQTGGTSTSASSERPPMVQRALARMLGGGYQILAAQEIPSEASSQVLVGLLPNNGASWSTSFFDTTSRMDNGFWYDGSVQVADDRDVLFTTGEKDENDRWIVDEERALHPPHVAHFTIGSFDFTMITLHLTFQGGDAEESRREMQVILDYVDEYFQRADSDPDIIICGDFNLPSLASGERSDGLTLDDIIQEDGRFEDRSRGLRVLVDDKTSRSPVSSGAEPRNNYDHFIISEDCLEEFDSARRFPTRVLTDDPMDPEVTRTSDHFPIVAFFRTSGESVRRDRQ